MTYIKTTETHKLCPLNLANFPLSLGFLRLPNATYVWSDGQPGEKQDGFWANDGLQILKRGFDVDIDMIVIVSIKI